jgi:hypothetical protein
MELHHRSQSAATVMRLFRLRALSAALGVILWVAVGHYYFGFSTEIVLLALIALNVTAFVGVQTAMHVQAQAQAIKMPERDFYVVTEDSYRWDITRNGTRHGVKRELGSAIQAFDSFEVAMFRYRQLEKEHDPLKLEGRDLGYHETFGYDEQETTLWVISAQSKAEAYRKVFFDESRRLIGFGDDDHALLVTDNRERQQRYLDWWGDQMDLARRPQEGREKDK